MCGIAGIFNLNGEPVAHAVLRKMTDAIAHRGPDGEGFYTDSFIGLGHRRLAILDLSAAGHQPMASADGQLCIAYNGEVYNYRELRAELEGLGHAFKSRTDTEVVLHAYAEWGEGSVKRFNGMFAFAIWDRNRQELFLARDRYGVKPLYYTLRGNAFLFGSEIKAMLAHPSCRAQMDKEALVEYLTFQNFFTDRTFFTGVRILPAGCWMRLPLGKVTEPVAHKYWDFDFREPVKVLDERECVEETERLIKQAVERQLVSDVELGTYLSGGMDSGIVTSIAARKMPYIKTFTCGFDLHSASGLELGFDERSKAEAMSYLFRTEHYEMVLKAGDMERILPRLAWHLEEPRVGQSYPNFYASQLASKFVKVVLAGTGSDELFGGYPWRYFRMASQSSFEDYSKSYYQYWQRLIQKGQVEDVFRPIWKDVSHVDTSGIFGSVLGQVSPQPSRAEDYVNASLYFEAKTFLHGLLVVEDKLSMANGLESRVPFLDNDLVDFAMRMPVRYKLENLREAVRINENEPGSSKGPYTETNKEGKLILRKMAGGYIPDSIINAQKQGFSAPDASWFKGESLDYVRRRLFGPSARIYDYLDRNSVQALVSEHLEGKQNRRLLIWSLLSIEEWFSRFDA